MIGGLQVGEVTFPGQREETRLRLLHSQVEIAKFSTTIKTKHTFSTQLIHFPGGAREEEDEVSK